MAFEVNKPNIENMQQYLSEEKNKSRDYGDGPKWWSIPTGMSSIRILPPWDPTGRVALAVSMHPIEYQPKGAKFKKYNWTCVNATFGKPCKICEGLQEMSASGVDISKWEANRRQYYLNAIIMHDPRYQASINAGKKPEDADGVAPGTHVLMRTPKTLYDWILSQITNPMVGDITSLTNGIDVYVTKDGTGLGTTYTPTLSPNGRTAVPQEYLDKITNLHNLDEIFSTGFDEKLIDELVSHLKGSAMSISMNVPNVVNQMAGYQNPGVPTPPQSIPVAPTVSTVPNVQNPYNSGIPSVPQPNPSTVAPNPFATTAPTPVNFQPTGTTPMMNYPSSSQSTVPSSPAPVADTNPNTMNVPKCFGQYNPSQVNCVVCPSEIACSQKSANK